ncbi:MAG TPA: PmoA family protein [Terriglobia bacterium]|nr:PmoA family protein [Terriglobia bacterium]
MIRKLTGLFSLALLVACPCQHAFGAQPVEFNRGANRIEVLIGGRPFTVYYFDPDVAKPYLSPLRSAQGTIVTRGFPMVTNIPGEDRDEPHQRAMYFAHGDINAYDFWGEAAFPRWSSHSASTFGRTVFRKLDEVRGGPDSGVLRAEFDLLTPEGQVIAAETQAYTFRGDEHSRIIDCEFTIRADRGPVKIGDTKEGTFAIRVVKALDSPPGRMMNSEGAMGEKAVWGKRADWVDFYGNVAGEEVGIAIFDDPKNLRHPTYWHARHYGLLAANPFGLKEFTHDRHQDGSYVIGADGSLTLRYRVFIHHGDFQPASVADAYRQYVTARPLAATK